MLKDITLGLGVGAMLNCITFIILGLLYNRYDKEWMIRWCANYFVAFLWTSGVFALFLFAYLVSHKK